MEWTINTMKIRKVPKEGVVQGQVLTPHLLYPVTGFSIDSDAMPFVKNKIVQQSFPCHGIKEQIVILSA